MVKKLSLIGIAIFISIVFVACVIQTVPEHEGFIGFKHSGAYVAKFFINWTEDGQPRSWSSGKKTAGYSKVIRLKGNAREITITAQADTGLGWATIFRLKLDEPPNAVYVVKGTTLNRRWETTDW
jgi:hypothetical protein